MNQDPQKEERRKSGEGGHASDTLGHQPGLFLPPPPPRMPFFYGGSTSVRASMTPGAQPS